MLDSLINYLDMHADMIFFSLLQTTELNMHGNKIKNAFVHVVCILNY